jgi:hypothetical protein
MAPWTMRSQMAGLVKLGPAARDGPLAPFAVCAVAGAGVGERWALPREGGALTYKNWPCEGAAAMRA